MADKNPKPPKAQLSIEEYMHSKAVRSKNKLKLHFPLAIKILLVFPALYILFLIIYFLMHLRFLSEH